MAARWPPAAPNQCYHIPEGESKHLPHYSYRSLEKTVIDVVLNHMTPPKKKKSYDLPWATYYAQRCEIIWWARPGSCSYCWNREEDLAPPVLEKLGNGRDFVKEGMLREERVLYNIHCLFSLFDYAVCLTYSNEIAYETQIMDKIVTCECCFPDSSVKKGKLSSRKDQISPSGLRSLWS